ncbi:cutinase [Microthyrium microscopicum]|uniref:cutinase n=1 Tax=Microthyrium microscopicum TaxID=703497 RepID=A0A6A6UEP5_9PEZI|nr:cutinase [Microthyrium microscopicum]
MKFVLSLGLLALATSAAPIEELEKRQLFGSSTKCGPVAVLFSRGTFEVGQNGMTVGPEFTTALQAVLPSGTVFWGNGYNNDVVGYLTGGSLQGISMMRAQAEEYVKKCPGIKLVLSGYSQGAQVTHKALAGASQAVKEATKAVVLFGDPMSGTAIPGISKDKINTICAIGDTICTGLPIITASHMVYAANSISAAAWVRSKIG